MRALHAVAIAAAMTLGGCAAASSRSAVDTHAEEQAIRKLDAEWLAATRKHDLDRNVSMYAPDAWLMWANTPTAKDRAAIRALWTQGLSTPHLTATFAADKIDVAPGGDVAIEIGTAHYEFDTPQGRTKEDDRYLLVWKKVSGMWKVQYDIYNADPAHADKR